MSAELPADSPDGAADDTPKVNAKHFWYFVGLISSISAFLPCVVRVNILRAPHETWVCS